ncbi:hypothetical protein BAUCODRAFT_27727 [Baudoinia panamericana UAMH 10762]|uniref:Apple domain-containing protein n=1 Tax=Baudoinia panamericana (strain UAMH 10762) TaxID=717646 RepID=M2LEM6_BAUPA|nr:uncharacterized protein BAUCODRAFT_27727 [Baudoinia panamericana UAMH 10762]EMC92447.1 hypothetical protein BAUCODRAFT_27727 [Baudoinia panamericana UAMH 10762]
MGRSIFAVAACVASLLASVSSAQISCPANNGSLYVSAGVTFQVECNVDRYGSDTLLAYTNTYNACLDQCAARGSCVDVSYVPGSPGPCYMKNGVNPPQSNSAVIGGRAVLNVRPAFSCPFANGLLYITPNGNTYKIDCDNDHYGGDFTNNPYSANSIESCAALCDSNSGCKGYVLSGTNCYLKTAYGSATSRMGLSAAKCIFGC